MVDLTKKKTLGEYETGALAGGDTVVTYRSTNAVGEKVFRGDIVAGTAASIADGTSTALKMYSDKALKDAVNTGAIPVGTDTEIETGTDTTAKLYAPDQLNSAINSLIETAVPDGTEAQIIAGTDTTERKFTPADINGAVKDIAVAQYAGRTAMKAATGLTAGDVVYLSEGGRSGQFIWTLGDFSAEVAADTLQGVYVASDAVAATVGCWVREDSQPTTADTFGGTYSPLLSSMRSGDPFEMARAVSKSQYADILEGVSTDDYAALINTVLEDAKVTILSPGKWTCSSGSIILPSRRGLCGRNPYRTFSAYSLGTNTVLDITHAGDGVVNAVGASLYAIEGLTIFSETAQRGINFDNGQCSIKNLGVNGSEYQGILLGENTIASRIEDIVSVNTMRDRASFVSEVGSVEIDGTDHLLSRVQCNGQTGFSTVAAAKKSIALYAKGVNHFLTDVIGEFGEIGINLACNKSRVVNARADRCMGDGVVTTGQNNSVTNAHAVECGTAAANTYYGFRTAGLGNTFTAPQVYAQNASNLLVYGFYDSTASNSQINTYVSPIVSANSAVVDFYNGAFLGCAYNFPSKTLRYNTGTTISVSGITGIYLYHSTATTITEFTGGVNNQEVRVHASNANITIEDNSGISLIGGVSRALVANEIITLINYNDVWYEAN